MGLKSKALQAYEASDLAKEENAIEEAIRNQIKISLGDVYTSIPIRCISRSTGRYSFNIEGTAFWAEVKPLEYTTFGAKGPITAGFEVKLKVATGSGMKEFETLAELGRIFSEAN